MMRTDCSWRRAVAAQLGAVVVAACLVLATAVPARAFWTAASGVGDSGAAAATAVNRGATPSASAIGPAVTVTWAPSTLANGQAVTGYVVKRYDAVTQVAQAILSACTGTVAATTCIESSVPSGAWVYTVTPRIAINWVGQESLASSTVTVESTAPVNAITLSSITGGAFKNASTVHYRGTTAGSFRLTNAVIDAGSGPASSATAALTGTTTGWTHTPSTVSAPTGGPYVSDPFSWAAATTGSPGEVVTGRDVAGNADTTSLTMVHDGTAPGTGTITYTGGYTTSTSVTVGFTTGSDGAGSGIGTRLLQRASAVLTTGTCGTFGSFANVSGGTNPASPHMDAVTSNTCYAYQYVVADQVGNSTTAVSPNVVMVLPPYKNTVLGTAGLLGYWRLGDKAFALDTFTGTAGAVLSARPGEIGATWTKWANDVPTAVLTSEGRLRRNGTGGVAYLASGLPASADYQVSVDVHVKSLLTDDYAGVVGRVNTGDTVGQGTRYMARYNATAGSWELFKIVGGVGTQLATAVPQTLVVGQSYRLALDMKASTIRLLVDGVPRLSATDAAIAGPGRGGVRVGAGTIGIPPTDVTGLHLDNFRITSTPPLADAKGTNDGAYSNDPTLGVVGAIAGDSDTAAQFDGVSDYATVTRQVADVLSVEFWFKSTAGIGTGSTWSQGAGMVDAAVAGTANDFGVALRSDGRVVAGVGNPDTSIVSTLGGYNNGAWHHVVFTRAKASGQLRLYVDGVAAGTATGNLLSLTGAANLSFGRIQSGSNYFAGSLDEVGVYTTVLSDASVAAHNAAGR